VVPDLNKNIAGSTDLAKKRHRSADLHTLIHPTSTCTLSLIAELLVHVKCSIFEINVSSVEFSTDPVGYMTIDLKTLHFARAKSNS